MASGRAVLDFGAFPGASHTSVAVAGLSDIPSNAIVRAWIDRRATTDHSADEHTVETIQVTAGDVVAGSGFTIHGSLVDQAVPQGAANGNAPLAYGQYGVCWSWEVSR
jgi:hypothetical protein